jgi:hypothetical protein
MPPDDTSHRLPLFWAFDGSELIREDRVVARRYASERVEKIEVEPVAKQPHINHCVGLRASGKPTFITSRRVIECIVIRGIALARLTWPRVRALRTYGTVPEFGNANCPADRAADVAHPDSFLKKVA